MDGKDEENGDQEDLGQSIPLQNRQLGAGVGYPALLDDQEILNTSIYSTNTEFSSLES